MIRGSLLLATLLATGLMASGCNGPAATPESGAAESAPARKDVKEQDVGVVLAEVNGLKVGSNEFDELYSRTVSRKALEEEGNADETKSEILDKLIADKLLYQEALAQGLDQDPRIQKMMINSLLRKDVYGLIKTTDIPEEELRSYFETHKDEFVVPEKVQVRRILIKVGDERSDAEAKALATDLQKQAASGKVEFNELAVEHSDDLYAKRGGDIGFISDKGKPGLDAKVVEVAFQLEREQVSDVFKTDEGYNIITVVNRRERIERTFDQMRGAVLRKVKTDKYKKHYDDYVAGLKKGSKVTVNDAKLKAHTVKMPEAPGPAGAPRVNLQQIQPGGDPHGGH